MLRIPPHEATDMRDQGLESLRSHEKAGGVGARSEILGISDLNQSSPGPWDRVKGFVSLRA